MAACVMCCALQPGQAGYNNNSSSNQQQPKNEFKSHNQPAQPVIRVRIVIVVVLAFPVVAGVCRVRSSILYGKIKPAESKCENISPCMCVCVWVCACVCMSVCRFVYFVPNHSHFISFKRLARIFQLIHIHAYIRQYV